jgi:hypothetical protein
MQPPSLPNPGARHGSHESVRIGQRLVIFGILLNLLGMAFAVIPKVAGARDSLTALALIFGLSGLVLGMTGVLRLAAGLHYRMPIRILLAVLTLVPIVNLVTLAILNSKATRVLRTAGYKVGFFGAKRRRRKRTAGQVPMQAPIGNFPSDSSP